MRTTWGLLASFLQIGLFSIGGGYAVIPLIQQRIVDQAGWLTREEFADVVAISQMTPGPLAVNASTFVGIRLGGVPGAVVATLGCVAAGVALSLLLYRLVGKHRKSAIVEKTLRALKAASIGLIAAAGLSIMDLALAGGGSKAAFPVFLLSLAALRKYRANPMLVLALTGLGGLLLYG